MEDFLLEQNLTNVFESDLEWVFVGGKGGVGKTTTSCCVALQMAKKRLNHPKNKVLLLSTDPAHNISDAFQQKFDSYPIQVEGVENLYAMEVDPLKFEGVVAKASNGAVGSDASPHSANGHHNHGAVVAANGQTGTGEATMTGGVSANGQTVETTTTEGDVKSDPMMSAMKDMVGKLPGIEEAMSFAELMKYIENTEFGCIIFDTAPTGHTLRLLGFPSVLEKGLSQMGQMLGMFGGAITMFDSMMRQQNPNAPPSPDINGMKAKMEELRRVTVNVVEKLKDASKCTFISVLIPEYLALYETERLIQELATHEIDASNLVVNQILYPENECDHCRFYQKLLINQKKYLDKIKELYADLFHVCLIPRQEDDVLGRGALEKLAQKYISGSKWPM